MFSSYAEYTSSTQSLTLTRSERCTRSRSMEFASTLFVKRTNNSDNKPKNGNNQSSRIKKNKSSPGTRDRLPEFGVCEIILKDHPCTHANSVMFEASVLLLSARPCRACEQHQKAERQRLDWEEEERQRPLNLSFHDPDEFSLPADNTTAGDSDISTGRQEPTQNLYVSLEHPPRDPEWHYPQMLNLSISPRSVIRKQAHALAHLHWIENLDAHRVNFVIRCPRPLCFPFVDDSDSASSQPPADLWLTDADNARLIRNMSQNFVRMAFLAFVADEENEDPDNEDQWSCPWPKPVQHTDWEFFTEHYLYCSWYLRKHVLESEDAEDGLPEDFVAEVEDYYHYWDDTEDDWDEEVDNDDDGDDDVDGEDWQLMDGTDEIWCRSKREGSLLND